MKKFLGKVSPIDSLSELEQRSSMELDPNKIKKLLRAEDFPEALAKLYRIISNLFLVWTSNYYIGTLELMLLKYTEYEILSFLKYDEAFTSLIKKSSL